MMSTAPTTAHATIIFQVLLGEVRDVVVEEDWPPELDDEVSVGEEPPNMVWSVFAWVLVLAEDIFSPAPVTLARTRTSVEACPHANEYHVLEAPRLEDLA
jgi:hypothetical protein